MDRADEERLPLLRFNRQINDENLGELIFVLHGIGFGIAQRIRQDGNPTLVDIRNYIEERLPTKADAILFNVLDALDLNTGEIEVADSSITNYNLRTLHPEVDLRLVVLSFLHSLNRRDYKALKDQVCNALGGLPDDRCRTKCDLAALLFDEVHLNHTSAADITSMYRLSKVFNRQRFFRQYCKRHNVSLGNEMSINADSSGEPSLILGNIIGHAKKHQRRQLCCESAIAVLCVLVAVAFIACIDLAANMVIINLMLSRHETMIMDHSYVTLSDDGFPANLDRVKLTFNTTKEPAVVNVYRSDYSVNYTNLPLQPQNELWAPDDFKRQPYNYKGQDTPIYGLKGSRLQFNVTFAITDSSKRDHNACLRLRIFTDYSAYRQATVPGEDPSPIVDGTIDQSDCLLIEEPVSWTYTFQTSSYVYAAIDVGAGTSVNGSITGVINSYNTSVGSLVASCSTLAKDSTKCNIELCGDVCFSPSHSPRQFLYLQHEHADNGNSNNGDDSTSLRKVHYESKLPMYNFYFWVSLLFAIFVPITLACAIACVKWCNRCCCSIPSCN